MFDVGFWELALIGVVALLIVGPERLPGVVRTAGRWAGQARRMVRDAKADLEREMKAHDLADLDDLKSDVQSAGREFQRAAQDIDAEVAAAKPGKFGDELRETLRGARPATTAGGGDSPGDGDSAAAAPDGTVDAGGDHYIYESRRGRAVLHAAHCTYCNHGRGRGGRGASKGAHWHGPYASRASAERAQRAMAATVKKVCACVERSATDGASSVAAAAASTTAAPASIAAESNPAAAASTAAESTPPAAASTAAESTTPAAASPTATTVAPATNP
ncbi:MAG: Sec-independent protein translocase protein TatB [Gammaproteobacteria bacterium]|nr:Sec-independent protein translocase protein TatB [Gammaproteobacteria bacterium]